MRHRHHDVIRLTGVFGAFDTDPSIKLCALKRTLRLF